MKTARRQELRTNELSAQIDQITEQVKQNYTTIITVIVGFIVVAGGIYWYFTSSRNRLMEGWASLVIREEQGNPQSSIQKYRDLIAQNLDPKLNAAAWMKIGETAIAQYTFPAGSADGGQPDPSWLDQARSAYASALSSNVLDKNAIAEANISLGIIAENLGEFDKAAEQYRKIINDPNYAGTPFSTQAEYRLKHLDDWRAPVVFAPPPPKPQPTTAEAGTDPASPLAPAQPGLDLISPVQPSAPVATTQPAAP